MKSISGNRFEAMKIVTSIRVEVMKTVTGKVPSFFIQVVRVSSIKVEALKAVTAKAPLQSGSIIYSS